MQIVELVNDHAGCKSQRSALKLSLLPFNSLSVASAVVRVLYTC